MTCGLWSLMKPFCMSMTINAACVLYTPASSGRR
jgi:hypothetical protein